MTSISHRVRASVGVALASFCLAPFVASTAALADDAAPAPPARIQEFVEVAPGRSLYVDYIRAQDGKPTVILINGLTYRTGKGCWETFAADLQAKGYGVFMWDMLGQGQTLLRYKAPTASIDYRDQIDDMRVLLDKFNLKSELNLFGLSYGGAIAIGFAAKWPAQIRALTLAAPYVAPIASQDLWIKMQVSAARLMFPFNPASNDAIYDWYLKTLVYATYPSAEPIVLENPYKLEATFRLAQGVRPFIAADDIRLLPPHSVHLLIAGQDQYIERSVHDAFWNSLPEEVRMSRVYVEGSEHKIPEAVPGFAAMLTGLILDGDAKLAGGRTYSGSPANGLLRETDGRIPAPAARMACADIFAGGK